MPKQYVVVSDETRFCHEDGQLNGKQIFSETEAIKRFRQNPRGNYEIFELVPRKLKVTEQLV